MGSIIVIVAGVFGLVCAASAYVLGFGVLVSLVIYALAGHLICAWLLSRYHVGEDQEWEIEEAIEQDIMALREREVRLAAKQREASDISVFTLLRERRQRN